MKLHLNECSMTGRVYSDNIILSKECKYLVDNSSMSEFKPERFMGPYTDTVLNHKNSNPSHIIDNPLPELILGSSIIDVSGEFPSDIFKNGMFDMKLDKLEVMNWTTSTPLTIPLDCVYVDTATYEMFNPDTVTNIVPITVLNTTELRINNLNLKRARSISLFNYENMDYIDSDISKLTINLNIGSAGHISLYGSSPLTHNSFIKSISGAIDFENTMSDGRINIDLFRGKHNVEGLDISFPNNTKAINIPVSDIVGCEKYIECNFMRLGLDTGVRTDIYFDFGSIEGSNRPTDIVSMDIGTSNNCYIHIPTKNKQFKNLNSLIVSYGHVIYSDDNSITDYSYLFSECKFEVHKNAQYIDFIHVTELSQCEGMFENSSVKNIILKNVRESLLNSSGAIIGIGGKLGLNYIIENIIRV